MSQAINFDGVAMLLAEYTHLLEEEIRRAIAESKEEPDGRKLPA